MCFVNQYYVLQMPYTMAPPREYAFSIHPSTRQIKTCSESPAIVLTQVLTPSYKSIITLVYATNGSFCSKSLYKTSLETLEILLGYITLQSFFT